MPPITLYYGTPGSGMSYLAPAEKSAVAAITVSPTPGHGAGSSLQAPAGAVVAGVGTHHLGKLLTRPCGVWRGPHPFQVPISAQCAYEAPL